MDVSHVKEFVCVKTGHQSQLSDLLIDIPTGHLMVNVLVKGQATHLGVFHMESILPMSWHKSL